jgi:hypothetical protein
MAGSYSGYRLFRIELQGGIATFWGVGEPDPSDPDNISGGLVLKTGFKFIPLHFFLVSDWICRATLIPGNPFSCPSSVSKSES